MKKSTLCIVLACAAASRAAIEFTWSPYFDRGAGTNLQYNNNANPPTKLDISNLPDATIYGANFESSLSGAIAPALQNAYNKGVRVIDIPFLFGSAFPTTPLTEQNSLYPNEQVNGVKWLKAVESFNSKQTVVANKFRVRIRFLAYASNLWVYAQYYLPSRLGLGTVSGLPALQDDYGALQANGQRSLLIPDLSNAKIRQAIGVYAKNIISEARNIARTTTIESMTLILDAGGETSLFPIDGEIMPYGFRTQQPFYSVSQYKDRWKNEDKVSWFKARTQILNSALKEFATQVHTQNSRFDGTGAAVKAGLFFQVWPGDGYYRGAFDFSGLLDGTGMDIVHHSMHPTQLPYYTGESSPRATTQADASIQTSEIGTFTSFNKRKAGLNIVFDTEYSWPWYSTDGTESFTYNSGMIIAQNATSFKNQAIGAIRYGANATTFANWTRYDMEKGYYRPTDHVFPLSSTVTSSAIYDQVLSSTAKTSLGSTTVLGTATRAIYISTVGKILAEIAGVENWSPEDAANAPGYKYYKNWFQSFGISPTSQRVDIITDGMLLKYPSLLSDYSEIYLPYETSKTVDVAVYKVLDAATDANKAKIKFQMAKNDGLTQLRGYDVWSSKVRVYNGMSRFAYSLF